MKQDLDGIKNTNIQGRKSSSTGLPHLMLYTREKEIKPLLHRTHRSQFTVGKKNLKENENETFMIPQQEDL